MATDGSAKAQKRLRKVEQAHTRLAELAERINAQAAAVADLIAQANRIAGHGGTRTATRPRKPAAPATRSTATARKTSSAPRKAPAARKATPAARKAAPAGRKAAPATRKATPATRKAAPPTRG